MSAPKAHRYLVSYSRLGLVLQEPDTGRYALGEFALRLGLAALGRLDPVTSAASVMRDLAQQIEQTVAVAIWANHGATIVRWAGVDSPVSATLRVGSVMPLSRSATGLLFLALLPERRSAALLTAELAHNAGSGSVREPAQNWDRPWRRFAGRDMHAPANLFRDSPVWRPPSLVLTAPCPWSW